MRMSSLLISLMGPPGSGKGTVAQMLARKGWIHFSMGQALREHIAAGGKFAKTIQRLNAKGILSPNKIVSPIFHEFLSTHAKRRVVLDGYPRNLDQVKGTHAELSKKRMDIDAFILIDVPSSVLVKRLSSRRQCQKCGKVYGLHLSPKRKGVCDDDRGKLIQREDDKPSTIRHRFSVYENETLPVVEWASSRYPVFRVDGDGSPTVVLKRVQKVISLLQKLQTK